MTWLSLHRAVVALDGLRPLVDLPGLVRLLDTQAAGSADPEALLRWYGEADSLVSREVTAGRATAADAKALQEEAFDLMAKVPGLQFATNEQFGLPDKAE